jgi:hypothetical protein
VIFPITPDGLALIVEEVIPEISGQHSRGAAEEFESCEECGAALDDEGCPFCQVDVNP